MASRVEIKQVSHVLRPLTQGRGVARQDIEPVVQVFPKASVVHRGRQVFVGGGHDPDVNVHLSRSTYRLNRPVLKNAKQFDLHVQRQVADFVEEQRAAVGHLEAAQTVCYRTSEGTLTVAEQFALEQILRDCAAIDRDKRTLSPGALAM